MVLLEATFIVDRVTSEKDRYAVVVANLPLKVVQRIPRTLVMEDKPYTTFKELVVKEIDLSDYQRSKKLHALPALGDQRPSELLALIGNLQPVQDCGCYCARYQFLSRMPLITRAQLVNQKDLSVDELAPLADTISLSQVSVQSLIAEVDTDRHNTEVLTVRQRPVASSPSAPAKKKIRSGLSKRSAGSTRSGAKRPSPAASPAPGRETGTGRHQGPGASPSQRETPVSSCSSPVPARAPAPPTLPAALATSFHARNPPELQIGLQHAYCGSMMSSRSSRCWSTLAPPPASS